MHLRGPECAGRPGSLFSINRKHTTDRARTRRHKICTLASNLFVYSYARKKRRESPLVVILVSGGNPSHNFVIPAQTGIQFFGATHKGTWIPACIDAGMTG